VTVIKCPTHGTSFIAEMCRHVAAACDADSIEPTRVVIDGWNNPNHLCQSCHTAAARVIAERESEATPGYWSLDLYEGYPDARCVGCLASWFERTGQGTLSEVVRLARSRIQKT
jgi:hypothetical protein